jgi:polar amino acid transport system permease protein
MSSSPLGLRATRSGSVVVSDGVQVQRDAAVRKQRHPWQTAASIVVLIVFLAVVYSFVTNERVEWPVIAKYIFAPAVFEGLRNTVVLTVASMSLGLAIGVLVALMKMSSNLTLKAIAGFYQWFFRGTPLLVQLIFWFNLSVLYPKIALGIPFGPTFFEANTNQFITVWVAALVGLGLNEGAYVSEIIRSGLISVNKGQKEAAFALGMTPFMNFRRVIAPQALRVIVPPLGNQVISMLKATALVSVIALPELLYSVQLIYSQTFEIIPLLLVACLWYLVLTTVLSIGQHFLERNYNRGYSDRGPRRVEPEEGN